jgi:hypothetical protein
MVFFLVFFAIFNNPRKTAVIEPGIFSFSKPNFLCHLCPEAERRRQQEEKIRQQKAAQQAEFARQQQAQRQQQYSQAHHSTHGQTTKTAAPTAAASTAASAAAAMRRPQPYAQVVPPQQQVPKTAPEGLDSVLEQNIQDRINRRRKSLNRHEIEAAQEQLAKDRILVR